jgi:hypothetical protein
MSDAGSAQTSPILHGGAAAGTPGERRPVDLHVERRCLSARAVLLGSIGVVAVCAVVAGTELVYVKAGFLQLPPAALGGLLLLVGARALLHSGRGWADPRALPTSSRWRLEAHERAAIYGMLLVAALASSRGLVEKMLPLLVAPNYFAGATNHWRELFFPQMRPWLVAFDPGGSPGQSVARAYYEGLRAGEPIPWAAWVAPVLAWGLLAGLVFFAFLCMASLLRRPWMEHERLSFPLAQLPLEMVREESGSFLRQPLMWLGFALPAVVYTLNGLHTWYPAMPYLEQPFVLNQILVDPPWNAVSWTPVYVSFAAIGLLYLVPGPLLFSLWFFFLLTRAQELVAAAYGYQPAGMPFFPPKRFIGYQTMGAYTVLAGYLLYTAWPHLRAALRTALRPTRKSARGAERQRSALGARRSVGKDLSLSEPSAERRAPSAGGAAQTEELLSERVAFGGLLFSLLGMALWCSLAGLSFGWALAQWVIYLFVVTLVLARSTAEGGLIATEVSFRPTDFYAMAGSIHGLGLTQMTGMAFMDAAWFRDQRGLVLAGLLEAVRVGRGTGLRRRALLGTLAGALCLSTLCGVFFQLWLPYRRGALQFYDYLFQGNPIWGFQYYTGQWNNPESPGGEGILFFGVGVAVTLALAFLRALLPWWPLHPLGYALCGSWTMILLWFPCLVTWALKGALLRYGGMRAFVRFRPLFLGMILGEFCMAILWTAIGALAGAPAPVFPWP